MSGFRVPRSGTPTFVGVPVTGDISPCCGLGAHTRGKILIRAT